MPMFFSSFLQDRLPASQQAMNWRGHQADDLLGDDGWLGNQFQNFQSTWSPLFDHDSDFHIGRPPDQFELPNWRQEIDEIRFSGPIGEGSKGELNVTGSVSSSGTYTSTADSLSGYHQLSVEPGSTYRAEVARLEDDLDPALWILEGHVTEEDIEGNFFSWNDPRVIAFGDDQVSFEDGPFGDPRAEFVVPDSGEFTVIVTNFASGPDDGGDGRFDYHLDVVEIEPIGIEDPAPTNIIDIG